MALVKNMMKIILLVIAFTAIVGAGRIRNYNSHFSATRKIRESIVCPMHFSKRVDFTSLISIHHTLNAPISRQFVLDFKPYATSFEKFRYAYPTFTIAVNGVANSDAIFGDAAKYKFGNRSYPTTYFVADGMVKYDNRVDTSASKWGAHYVKVKIDLGFQRQGTKLFVVPRMEGEVVGHGFYEKDLSIGLNIRSITFHPKI